VVQVLKSTCLKLARLSIAKTQPAVLANLGASLRRSGLDRELSGLNIPAVTVTVTAPPPTDSQALEPPSSAPSPMDEAPADESTTPAAPVLPSPPPGLPPAADAMPVDLDFEPPPLDEPAPMDQGQGAAAPVALARSFPVLLPHELVVPVDWNERRLDERADWVVGALLSAPMPPMPYRDPGVRVQDPEVLIHDIIHDLTGGPDRDISFIRVGSQHGGKEEPAGAWPEL
jgi:hypothetical protein